MWSWRGIIMLLFCVVFKNNGNDDNDFIMGCVLKGKY